MIPNYLTNYVYKLQYKISDNKNLLVIYNKKFKFSFLGYGMRLSMDRTSDCTQSKTSISLIT